MNKLRINKTKTKKDERYYIASSIRNGKRVSTQNHVSLGKKSELIKAHPDLEAWLKEQLNEYMKKGEFDRTVKLEFSTKNQIKEGDVKKYQVGDIFVERLFNEVGLGDLLDQIQEKHKFEYSLKDIVKFLLSQRLITPCSKRKMYLNAQKNRFNEVNFSLENIYRGMDVLIKNKNDILKWLYKNIPHGVNRNYTVLYFDGTNTYMETEIEEGLKARGKGKRNEIEPLVSFGLIMDGSGLPLSFVTFKGSGSECKELIPLEKVIEKDFRHTNFVMITDAGLSSKEIRCFNSIANKNFITVIPVRRMSEEKLNQYIFDTKKEWTTNNENYKTPESILKKYQELIEKRKDEIQENEIKKINDEISSLLKVFLTRRYPVLQDKKPKEYRRNNNDKYIEEDYIISFSLNYALRDKKQRDRLLLKAQKLIEKEGSKVKYAPGDPRIFVKEIYSTNDGEVATQKIKSLNLDLINKQARLDGYYAVSTSFTKEDDKTVIYWMKQRLMIEDTFLIMKQFLGFRPINHSTDNRIDAHFFTVFLTTLFYRYIQKICNESKYESLHDMSDEELFDLLRGFEISERKNYYFPNFSNNIKEQDIQKLFNVNLSNEIMKKSYVNKEYKKKLNL